MDVNVRTGSGTALHEAAQCGKTEVARTLLDHGINIHIRDIHRRTVEDLLKQFPAKAGPAVEIAAMLQQSTCKPGVGRRVCDSLAFLVLLLSLN